MPPEGSRPGFAVPGPAGGAEPSPGGSRAALSRRGSAHTGEGERPRHIPGGVSYLWAPHGSLCRSTAPWQVAASLAAPASPLPARRGRLQHPWQRGGQPGKGSREATQGQRQVGALEPLSPVFPAGLGALVASRLPAP